MTSPDGVNWTVRSAAEANPWQSVVWSPELGLFAAVANNGTNRVMTSPDGITWTARSAAEANSWQSIAWFPNLGLFAAVSVSGTNRVMTSPDGITWTARAAAEANGWQSVAWSPELGLFAAVADNGTSRVMTSKPPSSKSNVSLLYAGRVGVATTTPESVLHATSDATTTITFDSTSLSQGTCFVVKDVTGATKYMRILADNTWSIDAISCK